VQGINFAMLFRSLENPGNADAGRFRERMTRMRLSQLKEGTWAVIDRIGGSGALRRRILEMGLLKGTRIYVEKYAPLKDPMELIVKGAHISLRVEEAAQITVLDV
jgi:Fe2+ transport system protein FeoA